MQKISKTTIIRTAVLLLSLVNMILVMFGVNTIPIAEEELTELLSLLFTIGSSLWAWWKNNSFTPAAIEADKVKDAIKSGNKNT